MKNLSSIIIVVLISFLSSCVTINEFPIEVFQPAKLTLPPGIKNITLVSRNLKYTNDTLQNYYSKDYKRIKDIKPVNIDSMAIQACFDSLSSKMKQVNRFDKITVLPVSSLPVQYVKNLNPPSPKMIRQISSQTNADALILLDMMSSFYSVFPNQENGHSIAKVVTASVWTLYDASKVKIINHTSLIDTLYWDGLNDAGSYLASRIPNKKAAIPIAAGLAGVKYSKNIVPNWNTVKRQTLSCNKEDFKTASALAKINKWDEASQVWKKYTTSSNKRWQILSLYNLAIASEMNGDIDTANELISKASQVSSPASYTTENKIIRKYAAILAKRKIELNLINSQSYEN